MLCSHTRKYERNTMYALDAIRSRPRMLPRVVHVQTTLSIICIPRLISRALHPFPSWIRLIQTRTFYPYKSWQPNLIYESTSRWRMFLISRFTRICVCFFLILYIYLIFFYRYFCQEFLIKLRFQSDAYSQCLHPFSSSNPAI